MTFTEEEQQRLDNVHKHWVKYTYWKGGQVAKQMINLALALEVLRIKKDRKANNTLKTQ